MENVIYLCVYNKDLSIYAWSKHVTNAIGKIITRVKTNGSDVTIATIRTSDKKILNKQTLSKYWADNLRKQKEFQLNGEAAEMFNSI